ncbi:class I SAM-dependent methyltransferase [Zhongshania sp.]|uniref:class I SAM-dependent methyltransferase n=1 Tax=Zhongshania sp. TaxID=1971902 RepID=UPI003569DE5C
MAKNKNVPDIYYDGSRKDLVELIPSGVKRVLEIGCGKGGFAKNFEGVAEYWGVEPDSVSAKLALNTLTKVLVGTYDEVEAELPDGYFDLIVCNDVIEHMPDHDDFFQKIKCKIAVGGHLIGSVPNVRYYFNLIDLLKRRDWEYQPSGILDRTHLRFFTEKSLMRCLLDNGFVVDVLRGVNGLKKRYLPPKRMFRQILIGLLGQDVRYVQFGFRISLSEKEF